MTRRLITLDLEEPQYKAMRAALVAVILQVTGSRAKAHFENALKKLDDAWNAKGREGMGNNTKTTISDR